MRTRLATTSLIFSLLIVGCLPDSLTKFKEDPPQRVSQGGSSGLPPTPPTPTTPTPNTPTPTTPTPTTPTPTTPVPAGPVIAPTTMSVNLPVTTIGTNRYVDSYSKVGESTTSISFVLDGSGYPASDIVWSTTPGTLPTGMTLSTNSTGNTGSAATLAISPQAYTPYNEVTIQATYQSSTTFRMIVRNAASTRIDINKTNFAQLPGQKLSLGVTNASRFRLGGFIINEDGARGKIDYIEPFLNKLYVTICNTAICPVATTMGAIFSVSDNIDDRNDYYTNDESSISSLVYAFRTDGSDLPPGFAPSVAGVTPFGTNEKNFWHKFSVSPQLPVGIRFDTGNINFRSTNPSVDNIPGTGRLTAVSPPIETTRDTEYSFEIKSNAGERSQSVDSFRTSMSFLPYALPKTVWQIYYPINANQRLILQMQNASANDMRRFSTDTTMPNNLVSNPYGFKAWIQFVDVINRRLFVKVCGSDYPGTTAECRNNRSNTAFIHRGSLAGVPPNIATFFNKSLELDNAINFFSREVSLNASTPLTYVAPMNGVDRLNISPILNPLSSHAGPPQGVSGKIASVTNLSNVCNVQGINTKFNTELLTNAKVYIANGSGIVTNNSSNSNTSITLSQCTITTQSFTGGGADYIVSLIDHSTGGEFATYQDKFSIDPDLSAVMNSDLTFDNDTGTVEGVANASMDVPETTFTVSLENHNSSSNATNPLQISSQKPPSGLVASQNVLLNVPSASAFRVGDHISSRGGGTGEVKAIYRADAWTSTGAHAISIGGTRATNIRYDWIEVKVKSGRFLPLEEIDAKAVFELPRTYILDEGTKYFNIAMEVTNNPTQGIYDAFLANIRKVTGSVSNAEGFVIQAFKEAGGVLNREMVFVLAGGSDFSTADTLRVTSSGTTYTADVDAIRANSVAINLGVAPFPANHRVGADITSDNNDSDANDLEDFVGVVDFIDDGMAHVSTIKGYILGGATTSFIYDNPWTSTGAFNFTTAAREPKNNKTFYGHTNEPITINAALFSSYDISNKEDRARYNAGVSYSLEVQNIHNQWEPARLPNGLAFSASSGIISGTPTDSTERMLYRLKAYNGFGEVETQFHLKIHDSFEIKAAHSVGNSPAVSYILHRSGQGHNRTPCKVNRGKMRNPNDPTKTSQDGYDILCILDAGEGELYDKGLTLTVDTGDDMCQFVSSRPFSFYQYSATSSVPGGNIAVASSTIIMNQGDITAANCITAYNAFGNGKTITSIPTTEPAILTTAVSADPWGPSSTPGKASPDFIRDGDPAASYCRSDHRNNTALGANAANAPNCDEGSVRIITRTWTDGGATCTSSDALGEHNCTGDSGACISGPARRLNMTNQQLKDQDILLYTISNGNNPKVTHNYSSPFDRDYKTNRYLSNFPGKSGCVDTNGYNFDMTNYLAQTNSLPHNGATAHTGANSVYTFSCSNGSGDVLGRVHLFVRDWDRGFTASDAIDRMIPDAGLATNLMDSTAQDFTSAFYNVYGDWDNAYRSTDGALNPASTHGQMWVSCSDSGENAPNPRYILPEDNL